MALSYEDFIAGRREAPSFEEFTEGREAPAPPEEVYLEEEYGIGDVLQSGWQKGMGRVDRAMAGVLGLPQTIAETPEREMLMPEQRLFHRGVKRLAESGAFDWLEGPRRWYEERAEEKEALGRQAPPRGGWEEAASAVAGAPWDILSMVGAGKATGLPRSLQIPAGAGLTRAAEGLGEGDAPDDALRGGGKHGAGMLAFGAAAPLPWYARIPLLAAVGGKVSTSEGGTPYEGGIPYAVGGIVPAREKGPRYRDLEPQASAEELGRISTREVEAGALAGLGPEATRRRMLTWGERDAIESLDRTLDPETWARQRAAATAGQGPELTPQQRAWMGQGQPLPPQQAAALTRVTPQQAAAVSQGQPLTQQQRAALSGTGQTAPTFAQAQAMLKQQKALLYDAQAKIGALPDSSLSNWGDVVRFNAVDDFHHILRAERTLFGRQQANGAYETARKLRAVPNITEGLVKWGAPKLNADGSMKWIGQPLQEIMRPVAGDAKKLKLFKLYMTGKQADELFAQNRERLFSRPEIDAMTMLELQFPEFQGVFSGLLRFQKDMLNFYQDAGLLNAETRAKFKRSLYASAFLRERGPHGGTGLGPVLGGETGIHGLRGSVRNLKDPMYSLIEGPARMVHLAMENRARLKIADRIGKASGGEQFLTPIAPGSKAIKLGLERIEESMRADLKRLVRQNLGSQVSTGILRKATKTRPGPFEGTTRATMERVMEAEARRAGRNIDDLRSIPGMLETLNYWQGNLKPFGDDVMTVFRKGKPEYFRVKDPEFLASLEAFRRPEMTGVSKFLNATRRLVQASVTLDPTFTARNMSRDLAMSSIMTRTGFQNLTGTIRAWKDVVMRSPEYQEFVLNGGGGASFYDGGAALSRQMTRFAQRKGLNPRYLLVTPKDVYRFLDRIGRMGEEAPRVAEFKRAKASGLGAEQGAYLGREITTDFSMTGAHTGLGVKPGAQGTGGLRIATGIGALDEKIAKGIGKGFEALGFMTKTVPFLNAMIAGGDRLYRSVIRDPSKRGVTAAKMAMVPLVGAALHLHNMGNPLYESLPDWDKWTYWHFFLNGDDPDFHYRMPKLWEVGAMSSIMERMLDSALGTPDPDQALWRDTAKIIADNFGLSWPAGISQVVEQLRGKRGFTGEIIEPMNIAKLEPYARAKAGTSEIFKRLGEMTGDNPRWAQIPPARAEALYRGLFNAWAQNSLDLIDRSVFRAHTPGKHWTTWPVIRAFVERTGKYNRYVDKYYGLRKEVDEVYNTYSRFRDSTNEREQDKAAAMEAHDRKGKLIQFQKEGRKTDELLSMKRDDIEAVKGDESLSGDEKTTEIDKIRAEMNTIMEEQWKTWAERLYGPRD